MPARGQGESIVLECYVLKKEKGGRSRPKSVQGLASGIYQRLALAPSAATHISRHLIMALGELDTGLILIALRALTSLALAAASISASVGRNRVWVSAEKSSLGGMVPFLAAASWP